MRCAPTSLRRGSGGDRKTPCTIGQPVVGANNGSPTPRARRLSPLAEWASPSCRTSCPRLAMIISHQPRRLFRCGKFVPPPSHTPLAASSDSSHFLGLRFFDPTHPSQLHPLKILTYLRPCSSRALRIGTPRRRAELYATQSERGQRGGPPRREGGRPRGGREVDIFAIRAEIRVLQVARLVVRTMPLVISMSGRALHTLEQARAA